METTVDFSVCILLPNSDFSLVSSPFRLVAGKHRCFPNTTCKHQWRWMEGNFTFCAYLLHMNWIEEAAHISLSHFSQRMCVCACDSGVVVIFAKRFNFSSSWMMSAACSALLRKGQNCLSLVCILSVSVRAKRYLEKIGCAPMRNNIFQLHFQLSLHSSTQKSI